MSLATWELMSRVVTVIGLPMAIAVFLFEQRKEREKKKKKSPINCCLTTTRTS